MPSQMSQAEIEGLEQLAKQKGVRTALFNFNELSYSQWSNFFQKIPSINQADVYDTVMRIMRTYQMIPNKAWNKKVLLATEVVHDFREATNKEELIKFENKFERNYGDRITNSQDLVELFLATTSYKTAISIYVTYATANNQALKTAAKVLAYALTQTATEAAEVEAIFNKKL